LDLEFSPTQKKAVAASVTMASVLLMFAMSIGVLIAALLLVQRFSNIFFPLAVSGVLALLLKPYYNWWYTRTVQRAALSVAIVYSSIALPLCGMIVLVGVPLLQEIRGFLEHIPQWVAGVKSYLETNLPVVMEFWQQHELTGKLRSMLQQHSEKVTQGVQQVGLGAVSVGARVFSATMSVIGWAVVPIYVTLLLILRPISRDTVETRLLPFLKPETRKDVMYLGREFCNIIVAFFRGQLLIALIQGALFAVGFSIVGLKHGIVLGMIVGLLNIIPYLGSILGVVITFPLAFFQADGGVWTLVGVVVTYVIVQAIEGNLLTPRIMGDRTGLHPLAIIVAVLFWGSVFGGIMGMVLAIPLTAFLAVVWRLLREKYLEPVV